MLRSILIVVLGLLLGSQVFAQCPNGQCYRPAYAAPVAQQYQLADSTGQAWQHADGAFLASWIAERNRWLKPAVATPLKTAPAVQGDPYGFGSWLNAYRATAGLMPLAYSPELSGLCAANSSMGFGHHGPAAGRGTHYPYGYPTAIRENVGLGSGQAIWHEWTISNGHWQALLDASIKSYGIAQVGGVWTYNAR
jgi:hypothetical protein